MIAPRLASALRRSGRIATERPRVAAWTLVAATCALFVAGAALIAADHVERLAAMPRGDAGGLVVYLGEGTTDATAHALVAQLARVPGVERAELVGPADSAQRLERSLGADAALLDGVELASLPASVEVSLAPGVRDVLAMSPTIRALRGAPGVADVVLDDAAPDPRSALATTMDSAAWTAAAVLVGLAVVVVLVSLRFHLERSRRERDVHALLGASAAFSVAPAAIAGALHGAAASVIAALALVLGIARYGAALADSLASAFGGAPMDIALPAASALFAFVALGAALGFVGGGLAGASRGR